MAARTDELDVWIWTPGQRKPVLAGRVIDTAGVVSFSYDPDFLRRPNAMSIFERDLPRGTDVINPQAPHKIAPSLRDALPDRWGRRAVAAGLRADGIACVAEDEIDDITLMLRTGPDRIGGLYFCRVGEPPVLTMPFPPRLEIYIIPGNHDYYSHVLDGDDRLAAICAEAGVHFAQKFEFYIGRLRFLCATLWTDFQLDEAPEWAMEVAERQMNDYRYIRLAAAGYRKIRPADTIRAVDA